MQFRRNGFSEILIGLLKQGSEQEIKFLFFIGGVIIAVPPEPITRLSLPNPVPSCRDLACCAILSAIDRIRGLSEILPGSVFFFMSDPDPEVTVDPGTGSD